MACARSRSRGCASSSPRVLSSLSTVRPRRASAGGTASPDALSYYYLANIVVETNQAL